MSATDNTRDDLQTIALVRSNMSEVLATPLLNDEINIALSRHEGLLGKVLARTLEPASSVRFEYINSTRIRCRVGRRGLSNMQFGALSDHGAQSGLPLTLLPPGSVVNPVSSGLGLGTFSCCF